MKHTNFLVWSGIQTALPAHWGNLNIKDREREMYLRFQCGEIFFHTVVCKSKHVYYDFLVTEKEKFLNGFGNLKEDFGLPDSTLVKAFWKVRTVSSEMYITSSPFKDPL